MNARIAPHELAHAIRNMHRYGGSFAQALAEAALRADPDNLRRLQDAFPELFAEFSNVPESA